MLEAVSKLAVDDEISAQSSAWGTVMLDIVTLSFGALLCNESTDFDIFLSKYDLESGASVPSKRFFCLFEMLLSLKLRDNDVFL